MSCKVSYEKQEHLSTSSNFLGFWQLRAGSPTFNITIIFLFKWRRLRKAKTSNKNFPSIFFHVAAIP